MAPFYYTLKFFNLFVQICEISGDTFSIYHKKEDPSPLQVQKSNRMKYHCTTKWLSCHLAIISHETNMTEKFHECHQSLLSALD